MSRKRAAESDGELDQFFSQREGEKKERLMAGAISQLHLVNFMSHANFTAEFCSGVNFVVGANGSGKSAILAAICVAFGITGRKTNRTEDGVKGLVRTGTNSSTITLRLTNKDSRRQLAQHSTRSPPCSRRPHVSAAARA